MSSLDLEQTNAEQKTSIEAIFGLLNKSLSGIEKLVSLNLQTFKSTLTEHQEIAARALSAKDPHELLTLHASQAQPAGEKAQSYWRNVREIVSGTQAEFTTTIETQFKRYQHDVQAFVGSLTKHAPAGSEALFSSWKSVIENAGETFEATRKAAKRAVETVERNVGAALEAPTRSTRRGVEQAEADEKK